MRFDDLYDERRVYEGAKKKPLYEQEKVVEGYKSPTTDTTPMNVQRRPVVTDNKVVESVQTEVTPDNVQRRPGFEEQSKRVDWWNVPSYTAAVEEQRKKAEEAAALDVKRSKRKRDVALIGDMADVLARSIAHHGSNGAWMYNPFKSRSEEAQNAYENALKRRDGMAVDYAGKIAQAKMQDHIAKQKQQAADRDYQLQLGKAQRDAQQKAFDNALAMAKFEADKEKKGLDILLQQGKIDEQQYKVETARIEAAYADRVQKSIVDKNNAAQGEYIAYDRDGKPHRFKEAKAAEQFAQENDTWEEILGTTESVRIGSNLGIPDTTRTTTTRVIGGRAIRPKKKEGKLQKPNWGESNNNNTDW